MRHPTDIKVKETLHRTFVGCILEIVNESHLHAGHMGDNGTGASHYYVHIVWAGFCDLSRIKRHRMVLNALQDCIDNHGIHAVRIQADVA